MPYTGPRLWTPQQKPSPAATIDWNHPLARGLLFFAIPGGTHRRDLVSGTVGTVFGAASLASGGMFGTALATPDFSSGIVWPLSAQVMNGLTNSHNFSILVLANITAVNGSSDTLLGIAYFPTGDITSPYGLLFAEHGGGTDGAIGFPDTSANQQKVFSNNGWYQSGQGWLAYGVTRAGATVNWYLVGLPFSSTSVTDNQVGFAQQAIGNANGVTLFNGSGSGAFAAKGATGQVAFGALWNRALSATEMLEMSRAPYQFLVEPQNPVRSIYLLSKPGASTSTRTIPASAALLSTLTRTIPASAALQATLHRTIPTSAALLSTLTRTIPAHAALQATLTRTIPNHAALLATLTRTLPAHVALLATLHRTIPAAASLSSGSVTTKQRTIPVGASLYYLTIGYVAPSSPGVQVQRPPSAGIAPVSGPSASISISPGPSATIQEQ